MHKSPSAVQTLQGTGPASPPTAATRTTAQVLFEAYARAVGSAATWQGLPEPMKLGWCAVAGVKLG